MDAAFANPETEVERRIKALIDQYNAAQVTKLEQEMFKQRAQLADAERTLQTKRPMRLADGLGDVSVGEGIRGSAVVSGGDAAEVFEAAEHPLDDVAVAVEIRREAVSSSRPVIGRKIL